MIYVLVILYLMCFLNKVLRRKEKFWIFDFFWRFNCIFGIFKSLGNKEMKDWYYEIYCCFI